MFEQSFVDGGGARIKPWTVAASLVGQGLSVGVMTLIPLVYTYEIPVDEWLRNAVLLAPPPPPPPPAAEPVAAPVVPEAPKRFEEVLDAPTAIPDEVAIVDSSGDPEAIQAPNLAGLAGGVAGGVSGGVPGGIPGSTGLTVLPPAPIRVGGTIQAARILNRMMPIYPPEASEEGIGGTVRLEATITAEGAGARDQRSRRTSALDRERRDGRRAMALPPHTAQRRAGRSHHLRRHRLQAAAARREKTRRRAAKGRRTASAWGVPGRERRPSPHTCGCA